MPNTNKYISKVNLQGTEYLVKDSEARALIESLHSFTYEVVTTLPEANADNMNKIFLVADSAVGTWTNSQEVPESSKITAMRLTDNTLTASTSEIYSFTTNTGASAGMEIDAGGMWLDINGAGTPLSGDTITNAQLQELGISYLIYNGISGSDAGFTLEFFVRDNLSDIHEEFICILDGSEYRWEKIGDTNIDLSNYVTNVTTVSKDAITSVSANEFTPAGNITINASDVDKSVTINATGNVAFTPTGTISDQTVTITPATESISHLSVSKTGTLPTFVEGTFNAGTLPSKDADIFTQGSLPSFSGGEVSQAEASKSAFATNGIVAEVDGETLTFTTATTSNAVTECGAVTQAPINFNTGSLPTFQEGAFDKGTLPSKDNDTFTQGTLVEFSTTDKTVVTGITSASVTKATFTGDEISKDIQATGNTTISVNEVSGATFEGTKGNIELDTTTDKFVTNVAVVK